MDNIPQWYTYITTAKLVTLYDLLSDQFKNIYIYNREWLSSTFNIQLTKNVPMANIYIQNCLRTKFKKTISVRSQSFDIVREDL